MYQQQQQQGQSSGQKLITPELSGWAKNVPDGSYDITMTAGSCRIPATVSVDRGAIVYFSLRGTHKVSIAVRHTTSTIMRPLLEEHQQQQDFQQQRTEAGRGR